MSKLQTDRQIYQKYSSEPHNIIMLSIKLLK